MLQREEKDGQKRRNGEGLYPQRAGRVLYIDPRPEKRKGRKESKRKGRKGGLASSGNVTSACLVMSRVPGIPLRNAVALCTEAD